MVADLLFKGPKLRKDHIDRCSKERLSAERLGMCLVLAHRQKVSCRYSFFCPRRPATILFHRWTRWSVANSNTLSFSEVLTFHFRLVHFRLYKGIGPKCRLQKLIRVVLLGFPHLVMRLADAAQTLNPIKILV